MSFLNKLASASKRNASLLCVGLDPDPDLMGERDIFLFNKAIIDATSDLVCAYKPNSAFYEAMGIQGLEALIKTRDYIPAHIPVILDAKRGDIGNTSLFYARAVFDTYGFDAVTVSPLLGRDSLEPFMGYRDKGVFILCRTSNPGASDFQDLNSSHGSELVRPLYQVIAQKAVEWNGYGNLALVVGATYPGELRIVREICPDMTILVPGVGPQGGDLEAALGAGLDRNKAGLIINSSRGVIYASRSEDYPEAAHKAAQTLRDNINSVVDKI